MQSTTSSKRQQDVKPTITKKPAGAGATETSMGDEPKGILERLKAYVDLKFPATMNELPHIKDPEEKKEIEQEQLQEMMTFFLDQVDYEDSVQFMQLAF